jgi:hypothetical protein
MKTTILHQNHKKNSSTKREVIPCVVIDMELKHPVNSPWYSGIIKKENPLSKDSRIRVIDRGHYIEFILPRRTAQFTEISIYDSMDKLIWKTQSLNNNSIIWDKLTLSGGRVPEGRYRFRMKQGNHQINGNIKITS